MQIMDFYKQADFIVHDCETTPFKSGVHANYLDLKTLPPEIKGRMILAHYSDKVDLKPFLPLQNPLPLTFFGNARDDTETDKKKPLHKPSEGLVKAEKNGDKITKLVSEIFVSTPQP